MTRGVVILLSGLQLAAAGALGQMAVVDRPDRSGRNAFYAGNRAPLATSPLVKLPVGAVRPQGELSGGILEWKVE